MTDLTTSVPNAEFTDQGLSTPDEADILQGVLSDLNIAMGGGMSQSLTTPQGQIASSESAIIAEKNSQLAHIVNQVNPDFASGRFQDAIGRIYFIDRYPAKGTTVTATCTGLVGAVIPQGSVAQDTEGYLYFSTHEAVIPASGAVDVIFQNGTTGEIGCPIGSLNTIYKAVTGWSGVINNASGVLGSDEESRANFEYRRRQSVAKNSRGANASVYGSILEVDGVVDAYVIDNPLGISVTKGITNYTLLPHSIYIAVYGGRPEDIAQAIYRKKNLGCDMNGNTSFTISDTENYANPAPEYTLTWETPSVVDAYIKIDIDQNNLLPSNIIDLVKESVINSFYGKDNGAKVRIGSLLSASRFYAGIYSLNATNMNVESIQVSKDGISYGSSITFGIDEMPSLSSNNVIVNLV